MGSAKTSPQVVTNIRRLARISQGTPRPGGAIPDRRRRRHAKHPRRERLQWEL
jgi:hypothetical protein